MFSWSIQLQSVYISTRNNAVRYIFLRCCYADCSAKKLIDQTQYTVKLWDCDVYGVVFKGLTFHFCPVEVADLLRADARLLSCMSVVARVTVCLQLWHPQSGWHLTPLVLLDCILPHSPTHSPPPAYPVPPILSLFISLPSSPLSLCNPLTTLPCLCTLLLYVVTRLQFSFTNSCNSHGLSAKHCILLQVQALL